MAGLGGINLEHASGYSASVSVVTHPPWLNNTHISSASFAKNLNLNISSSVDVSNHLKQSGQWLHDQDSSSTQSTGQSHQGVIMRAGNVPLRFLSAKSCGDDMDGTNTGVSVKSVLSLGASETNFSSPKVNFSESDAGVSYTCIDPCLVGSLAAYGSHGIINTQLLNNAPPGRVPLPYQLTDDGPIYVNFKQYHGILRRRRQRAKLAALNKLVGIRKPYLHESRHRHAMRRIRGPGGRFLNTKQLKEQDWQCQQDDGRPYVVEATVNNSKTTFSAPSMLAADGRGRLLGFNLQLTNAYGTTSDDSPASDITNVSNPSDTFDHVGFTEFLGGTSSGIGMMYNGSQLRVPVIR